MDITSARRANGGLRHIAIDVIGIGNIEAKVVLGGLFRSRKSTLVSFASYCKQIASAERGCRVPVAIACPGPKASRDLENLFLP